MVVGSKYFTIPWTNFLLGGGFRFGQQSLSTALDATLKRLGTDCVDLYQIHFPFPTYSQEARFKHSSATSACCLAPHHDGMLTVLNLLEHTCDNCTSLYLMRQAAKYGRAVQHCNGTRWCRCWLMG